MESERYLVKKTILRFHELPFWNPYTCGGRPAWAGLEGDSVVVAPWLPAYLFLALPVALRVELFFFDRAVGAQPALGPPRAKSAMWTGVCLAMMVYTGGVDALPQTAVVLGAYAVLVAVATRSARPLTALALAAAVSVGLSAPKLLLTLETMSGHGQAVDASASLTPEQLTELLTDRVQGFTTGHAGIADSSWHEVGMYLGWAAVVAIGVGAIAGRGVRVTALKVIGIACLAFGLGSFSPYAPFSLVHHLPVFRAEHVPYRWLYPAALLLACVAVAARQGGRP
jgi:hypothetical protein